MVYKIMWKIYYDDGFVFEGDENAEIPKSRRTGVIVIAEEDQDHGRNLWQGADWYFCRNGRWYGADLFGVLDQTMHCIEELNWVLAGRTVEEEKYNLIVKKAMTDEGMPPKTARRPIEKLRN